MNNSADVGRWIGAGMLCTFAIGMLSNFKFQADLFAGEGLLVNAAVHPLQIGAITLAGLAGSLLSVWVATLLLAHVRQRLPVLTVFYLAIVVAGLALSAMEYASLIAFRNLGESFAAAGADNGALYAAPKAALNGLRNGLHFLDKLLGGLSVLTLFCILFKARLVPPALSAFGMLAAVLQMIAVGRALFGFDVIYVMLAPVSLVYVILLLWLLVKGFARHADETGGAAPVAAQAT